MFWKNNIPKKWKNEGRPTKLLIASVLLVIQFQKPTFGSYIHNKLIYWDIYIKRNAPLSFKISCHGENFYIWYHCYLWEAIYWNLRRLILAIYYYNEFDPWSYSWPSPEENSVPPSSMSYLVNPPWGPLYPLVPPLRTESYPPPEYQPLCKYVWPSTEFFQWRGTDSVN